MYMCLSLNYFEISHAYNITLSWALRHTAEILCTLKLHILLLILLIFIAICLMMRLKKTVEVFCSSCIQCIVAKWTSLFLMLVTFHIKLRRNCLWWTKYKLNRWVQLLKVKVPCVRFHSNTFAWFRLYGCVIFVWIVEEDQTVWCNQTWRS